ncbi:MAG TPA: hypothetical protein VIM77_04025 [Mucilaginibacter sp.]
MKLVKISIIAFVMLFAFIGAKAQSLSVSASFGYHYPHRRVIVDPGYEYYSQPVYYGPRAYYGGPAYYMRPRYYGYRRYYMPYHGRPYHHYRRW